MSTESRCTATHDRRNIRGEVFETVHCVAEHSHDLFHIGHVSFGFYTWADGGLDDPSS